MFWKILTYTCFDSNRYHSDEDIKRQFAEMEGKNITIANFDANDSEISMHFPSLRLTADVSNSQLISNQFDDETEI